MVASLERRRCSGLNSASTSSGQVVVFAGYAQRPCSRIAWTTCSASPWSLVTKAGSRNQVLQQLGGALNGFHACVGRGMWIPRSARASVESSVELNVEMRGVCAECYVENKTSKTCRLRTPRAKHLQSLSQKQSFSFSGHNAKELAWVDAEDTTKYIVPEELRVHATR